MMSAELLLETRRAPHRTRTEPAENRKGRAPESTARTCRPRDAATTDKLTKGYFSM